MRENDRQTRQMAEAQSMHHWRYKVGNEIWEMDQSSSKVRAMHIGTFLR